MLPCGRINVVLDYLDLCATDFETVSSLAENGLQQLESLAV